MWLPRPLKHVWYGCIYVAIATHTTTMTSLCIVTVCKTYPRQNILLVVLPITRWPEKQGEWHTYLVPVSSPPVGQVGQKPCWSLPRDWGWWDRSLWWSHPPINNYIMSIVITHCVSAFTKKITKCFKWVYEHYCSTILLYDETRGFSKDQLKGKQLSPTFQPDALVIFRAKV